MENVWMLPLIEFMALLALGAALVLLVSRERRLRALQDVMYRDAFNLQGYGLVLFDLDGRFKMANDHAAHFLPFLKESPGRPAPTTLSAYLNYIFENAAEPDAGLQESVGRISAAVQEKNFFEIIHWGDGYLGLVELQRTEGGGERF